MSTHNMYHQMIRALSDRIVQAQRPIRILDAIKWDAEIQETFFRQKCKALPAVSESYYDKNPLKFDPQAKIEEFYQIERDICRQLGQFSSVGSIMQRICREYSTVVLMLQNRGNKYFSRYAQQLYGSSDDAFYAGAPTLQDLALVVSNSLSYIQKQTYGEKDKKKYNGEQVVEQLSKKLGKYFADKNTPIQIILSDGILADAAAGAECIKIRNGAKFSKREIRVLEVHEGWVHLGTTLNGLSQPTCTFLSKGPPSSTVTQEGLAIIMEIFTFSSNPERLQRLIDRVKAINMVEQGADFLDVFNFFREQGNTEEDSYTKTTRVFRGSTPTDGPFTKDLSYNKGFILIYNYIRLAIQRGLLSRIPLLFVGKTTLEDLHILNDLVEEGVVVPPKYLPPQFKDLAALSAWMSYSLFLNQLDLKRLASEYKGIL